jgi:AcrR family transcriptional regulator
MPRVTDTRERILCAAEEVVIREGVARLTLEAAAAEAGVSKGGVLYHFPTRAALVAGMIDRFVVTFDANLERFGAYGGKPGDFVRAYAEATLTPPDAGTTRDQRLGSALLAGVASDPDLLEPLRDRFLAWQSSIEWDGIDPAIATVVRYAADGMWLCDLFGLAPLREDHRRAVGQALRAIIDKASET